MEDEKDDPPELFDGVEEAQEKDRPAWKADSPFSDIANILLWRVLEDYGDDSLFEPEDRPRGILSKADRDYLYGLKDYSHAQSEANRKQDIRERIEHGLKDFKLLWVLLDTEEREKVFEEIGDKVANDCIEAMFTFAYLGLDQDIPRLEERIERGVLAGANAHTEDRSAGQATNVNVSIEIDYNPDIEVLSSKLREGNEEELTAEEIGVLAKAGKLEPEDLETIDQSLSNYIKNDLHNWEDSKPE